MVPVNLMEQRTMSRDEEKAAVQACYRLKNQLRSCTASMATFENYLQGTEEEQGDFPVNSITLENRELTVICLGQTLKAKGRPVYNGSWVAEYMFTVTDDSNIHRVLGVYVNHDGAVSDSPEFLNDLGNINEYGPLRWMVALRIAQALLVSKIFAPAVTGVTPVR